MELRGEAVLGRAAAAASVARFCKGIVDAVGPYVVAAKPQSAFFEALGSDGVRALEEVCDYARGAGLLVLLDAKRGDIGSTARGYATAYLEPREDGVPLADAMTASPYLGQDSVEPFLAACRRYGSGVFFLVRTSNAGAADIQDLAMSDSRPLWHHVAELVREWGEPLVGERGCRASAPSSAPRSASRVGRAEAASAHADAPARSGRAGRDTRRRRPGIHGWSCERARHRVALVIYAYRESEADWRAAAGAEAQQARRPGVGGSGLVARDE